MYVLQQTQHQHGQHLQFLTQRQLRARARAGRRHARLVRLQDLDELIEERIAAVLELVRDGVLDALVREQRRDGHLVRRCEDFGEVARRRERGRHDADPAFAWKSG